MKTLPVATALALAAVLLHPGCASSPAGIQRETNWINAGTNAVGIIQRDVIPITPPPLQPILQGLALVASAGLAWAASKVHSAAKASNGTPSQPPPAPTKTV